MFFLRHVLLGMDTLLQPNLFMQSSPQYWHDSRGFPTLDHASNSNTWRKPSSKLNQTWNPNLQPDFNPGNLFFKNNPWNQFSLSVMQCLHVIRYRSYYWTALLQLSLTSIPSAPFEPTIYTIEARYDILAPVFPYFLSKPEKKHWDASFWPGAKKNLPATENTTGRKKHYSSSIQTDSGNR